MTPWLRVKREEKGTVWSCDLMGQMLLIFVRKCEHALLLGIHLSVLASFFAKTCARSAHADGFQ